MSVFNLLCPAPALTDETRILLFFGSPRTGSTLLGQILNQHPNMLIANEYRFLQKIVRDGRAVDAELKRLKARAWSHFKKGLQKDSYFSDKLSKFQSQWVEFDQDKSAKRELKIVGDKKAGGNTLIYLEQPTKTKQFISAHNPYLLQIIRNPVVAAYSAVKAFDLAFEDALKDQIMRTTEAYRLLQDYPALRCVVYYEDLIRAPEPELNKLLAFLGLQNDGDWIDSIKKSLNQDGGNANNFPAEEISLAKSLIKRYQAEDIFAKYEEFK